MTFKPYPHARGDGSLGEGWAMLRARVARRMALGLFSERVSIGLTRDLSVAVEPPAAKIPVRLRDFRPDDLPVLFPVGGDKAAERERDDVRWRLRAAAHGVLPSRCFVLVDEVSGRPCHIQWLTGPGYGDAIRRTGALPVLSAEEAMLENAFTPASFRGLGVMAAAVYLIAERARLWASDAWWPSSTPTTRPPQGGSTGGLHTLFDPDQTPVRLRHLPHSPIRSERGARASRREHHAEGRWRRRRGRHSLERGRTKGGVAG
ncbi:hypothetical protein ACU4GR_03155 [Methylobacterium oryzae CBMB20]